MARTPRRRQKGFTLFELLVVLAIIGILWGVGISVTPRLLSGSGPDSAARRLAEAGQEARQMALLQKRPWELLLDLNQGVFYRAPLGAVEKRELRASGELDDEFTDPADESGNALFSRDAQRGEIKEQDLIALRQEELNQPSATLRTIRRYDRLAFNYDGADSDIFESSIPEEVRIIQIWKQGGYVQTEGRASLVFGPRGFIRPTAVWLEAANSPGKIYTVYFSGIVPPVVANGMFLPNEDGVLKFVELP